MLYKVIRNLLIALLPLLCVVILLRSVNGKDGFVSLSSVLEYFQGLNSPFESYVEDLRTFLSEFNPLVDKIKSVFNVDLGISEAGVDVPKFIITSITSLGKSLLYFFQCFYYVLKLVILWVSDTVYIIGWVFKAFIGFINHVLTYETPVYTNFGYN